MNSESLTVVAHGFWNTQALACRRGSGMTRNRSVSGRPHTHEMDKAENTRKALAVLTAWVADGNGDAALVGELLAQYEMESLDSQREMVVGLLSLSTYLLILLEKAGYSNEQVLAHLGQQLA